MTIPELIQKKDERSPVFKVSKIESRGGGGGTVIYKGSCAYARYRISFHNYLCM